MTNTPSIPNPARYDAGLPALDPLPGVRPVADFGARAAEADHANFCHDGQHYAHTCPRRIGEKCKA